MSIETKRGHKEKKAKLQLAKKEFTREKAMHDLANGADFTDSKFTAHRNYHVREAAWKCAGSMVPESMAERKELCERLTKGRTDAGKASMEAKLGLT